MKRTLSLFSLIALFAMALAACGGGTAAQPTTAPAATEAPAATTEAPAATTETPAATTEAPAATTEAPAGGETAMMPIEGTITLWHPYSTGGAEEMALNKLVDEARAAYPEATINVLQVPFDQVFNKFRNEVTSGGGPDVLLSNDDEFGNFVREGLLADLSEYQSMLTDVSPVAVEAMTIDGKLYAIPESFKAVALYYDKSKVATPPATTDELLAAIQGGNTFALNQGAYHSFGWLQAFGGQLMDESGTCVADQAGGEEWFTYLQTLKAEPNATLTPDDSQASSLFQEGKADMIINGPWALGDYRTALGENLAVAPVPGADEPAGPMTGVDGLFVSVNSANVPGAVALALYLTSPESAKVYADEAGHVVVNTNVDIGDELVASFAEAAQTGVPRPRVPELSNFWTPFGNAITSVLDGGAEPATAIAEACTTMNTANNK